MQEGQPFRNNAERRGLRHDPFCIVTRRSIGIDIVLGSSCLGGRRTVQLTVNFDTPHTKCVSKGRNLWGVRSEERDPANPLSFDPNASLLNSGITYPWTGG